MPLLIPPYYLQLFDAEDLSCPLRRQCVPHGDEARLVPGDLVDPLGEESHEVVPRLIRRYPDRALLLVTSTCAVNCRFCTRSRIMRVEEGWVPRSELAQAFSWLRENPQVREVIVSGGDPLVASTRRLSWLFEALRAIPSVDVLRVGTRTPAVLPMRIDAELIATLRAAQPLWLMVHFNHARELTAEACAALARLADGGIPLMNQTVLLRGVNDRVEALEDLFRGLIRNRVRPYYLLHADAVGGTSHLRTELRESIALMGALQGRCSGIAMPKLVVDTPEGRGKVPVGPPTIVHMADGRTTLRTYRGELVDVIDPV